MKCFSSPASAVPVPLQPTNPRLSKFFNLSETPPCKFTLFTHLPFELQVYIWKLSIPGPQIIRVKVEVDDALHNGDLFAREDFNWDIDHISAQKSLKFSAPFSQAPSLLATCKDSRNTILSVYSGTLKSQGDSVIRFDSDNDTIFLLPSTNRVSICPCQDQEVSSATASSTPTLSENHRKPMFLGLGTREIPTLNAQRSRDFSPIFGCVKKLIMVWSEFFCVHSADITWTLSNFAALQELTLVTAVQRDAYCSAYLQAVGSPTVWSVEQISSHFASAQWLVQGLRNDMITLDRFRQKLESRKQLYYRQSWKLPPVIRFGGCFSEWVEGREHS
ncbi:BgTH12-03315 [Blumeria graminis f. sp. triticale]|uniref:BgtAc-30611 n=3 Tax=Blumeria graminis TaxID=34373 RepID=A0A9X9MJR7_BLUGR|nr:hypothetical protein BGT96224_Ac30611 [Blumeria graminis f. sp. tritici 96224]CAD6503656.1 BgTH12-03315 [Blumeria graminis f. sp. triticale]VDB89837.1 BgtAc-30611 [Blumeria graminis f. sp. tritici]